MVSFINYVDKMGLVGGPKMSVFVHFQGKFFPRRDKDVVKKDQNLANVAKE